MNATVSFFTHYFGSFMQNPLNVMAVAILQMLFFCTPVLSASQLPTVNLIVNDDSASEAGPDPGSFVISRSDNGIVTEPLNVQVAVTGDAGSYVTPDCAYTGMNRVGANVYQATIPSDQLSVTIVVTPIQDGKVEDDEDVIFTLQMSNNDYILGTDTEVQFTIADDSPVINLSVNDGDASEAGPNPGSFIISRSDNGIVNEPLNVQVAVTGNAGSYVIPDCAYTGMNRVGANVYQATIPSDQLSVTIVVTPIQDGKVEDDEDVIFTLQSSTNSDYILGTDREVQLTIADDSPVVNLSVNDGDASEVGPNPGSFIISRSDNGIVTEPLNVQVAVTGDAGSYVTPDCAYTGMNRVIGNVYQATIPSDQLSVTIVVTPIQDGKVEDDEDVIFTLQSSTNSDYILGTNFQTRITIADYVGDIFQDSFEDL